MDANAKLFDSKIRYCEWCHRPLAEDVETELCPACFENQRFREVREYVRENIVNEFQLAEAFDIPLRQVKQWIHEGRLEYREEEARTIATVFCKDCGKEIRFGNRCPECVRASYGVQGGFETFQKKEGDEQMRFRDRSKND